MKMASIKKIAKLGGPANGRVAKSEISGVPLESRGFDSWYASAHQILSDLIPKEMSALEQREGWLRKGESAAPSLDICVIGCAGSGKSTLINSLISDRLEVLPSGGVGPYTAAAIAVRHATRAELEFHYKPVETLGALAKALERLPDSDTIGRARLLLCDDQFSDADPEQLSVLLAQVRHGLPLVLSEEDVEPDHAKRLCRTIRAIGNGSRVAHHIVNDISSLNSELEVHATGFLAPLTESIEIRWQSPVLESGLCLVDLPGFGIANDHSRAVASRELASSRGVLWVVDRSGLTTDTLTEVEASGILERLANEPDDDRAPRLTVAISKLDLVALDERRQHELGTRPKFATALEQVREAAVAMVTAQLREALRSISSDAAVQRRTLHKIGVFGVAPFEHRRLHLNDEDEPARVASASSTGIPLLTNHLHDQANRHRSVSCRLLAELFEKQIRVTRSRKTCRKLEELKDELRTHTPVARNFL